MKKLHRSQFIKSVKDRFPQIRGKINQEKGLLTFEVSVFIKFVQRRIDEQDFESVRAAFEILNKYYMEGNVDLNHTIRNAICEDLDLSSSTALDRFWALKLLPEQLKKERKYWFEFMGYKSE